MYFKVHANGVRRETRMHTEVMYSLLEATQLQATNNTYNVHAHVPKKGVASTLQRDQGVNLTLLGI